MNRIKSIIGLFSLLISLNGCVGSIPVMCFSPVAGTPLLFASGMCFIIYNFSDDEEIRKSFANFGMILDTQKIEHSESMNELPLSSTVAKKLGVEVSDLENYNRNLSVIRSIQIQLLQDFKSTLEYMQKNKATGFDPSTDPVLNAFAVRYGFSDFENLKTTLEGDGISETQLKRFATSDAVRLDPTLVKIMLKLAFHAQFKAE